MGSDKLIISSKDVRVYVLVEVQPGKEVDFGNEILSNGLVLDSKVERLDFVHGYFDFYWTKGKIERNRSVDNSNEKISICNQDSNADLFWNVHLGLG